MGENEDYEAQLDKEIADLQSTKTAVALSGATKLNQVDKNIVEFQLDTKDMLIKLERYYRGEYEGFDAKGRPEWKKPTDKELITFNEYGVNSLMEIVNKYIDKNTMLSTYEERRILEIMGDLGDEMVLFILCNYEKIGMDSYFKKTKFRIIIATTLHIIESTYRRAMRGQTRIDLNQNKIVTQTDLMGSRVSGIEKKKSRTFDPRTWI